MEHPGTAHPARLYQRAERHGVRDGRAFRRPRRSPRAGLGMGAEPEWPDLGSLHAVVKHAARAAGNRCATEAAATSHRHCNRIASHCSAARAAPQQCAADACRMWGWCTMLFCIIHCIIRCSCTGQPTTAPQLPHRMYASQAPFLPSHTLPSLTQAKGFIRHMHVCVVECPMLPSYPSSYPSSYPPSYPFSYPFSYLASERVCPIAWAAPPPLPLALLRAEQGPVLLPAPLPPPPRRPHADMALGAGVRAVAGAGVHRLPLPRHLCVARSRHPLHGRAGDGVRQLPGGLARLHRAHAAHAQVHAGKVGR